MIISLSLIFQLLLALSREEAFQAVYLLIRLADKIPSRTKAPQEHSIQHKKRLSQRRFLLIIYGNLLTLKDDTRI